MPRTLIPHQPTLPRPFDPVERATARALRGFDRAPHVERAAFMASTSFAVTIATSRTINYVRERHRPMPKVRSAGRLLAQAKGDNDVRVHHFLPGIGIGFGTAAVLLARGGRLERWLSAPYATGLALTTDELRVLAGRDNPYWGGEHFALAQGAAAALVSIAIGVDFLRRGADHEDGVPELT